MCTVVGDGKWVSWVFSPWLDGRCRWWAGSMKLAVMFGSGEDLGDSI